MKKLDVLILSNAKSFSHYCMTQSCIDSILRSSPDIEFNIIVTETAKTAPIPSQDFKGEKAYIVFPMNDVLYCGGYQLPGKGCTSAWIEEFYQEFWVTYRPGGMEHLPKKLPIPSGYVSGGDIFYRGAKTVHIPGSFNYAKCINYCLKNNITSDWLVIQNNDTIAHPGAYDKMLEVHEKYGYESLSPKSDIHAGDQIQIKEVQVGNKILREVSGFCIMVKRAVYDRFPGGKEDEQFWFLHIDCQYSMMLMKLGIKHAIVPQAIISHNHEQSHEPMALHMEWSKESTRRFFYKFPSDYGVWATGNHSGTWSYDVIHDKTWRAQYAKDTGLPLGYGEAQPITPPNPISEPITKRPRGRPKVKK
jgi:hypothetical protein